MDAKEFLYFIKRVKNALFRKKTVLGGQTGQIVKTISRNGAKDCFSGDDSLSFNCKQELIKADINKEARNVIKQAIEEPEALLEFVKSRGTVIVKSPYMAKVLKFFGQEEGFIPPISGIKAFLMILAINLISPIKLEKGFKTPVMFALSDKPVNIYTISHQFHLWLSYINKLPGFEEKNMRNFRAFWNDNSGSEGATGFSVEEIFSLKDIIAREMEALSFVKEMAREFVGQKNSLNMLKQGKSINL